MTSPSRLRQQSRVSQSKACGAFLTGSTARNGWARFHNVNDAHMAVELMVQDDSLVVTVIYSQGEQIALDWSDEPRYANGNVIR
jgi:hypothetical protein